MADGNCIAQLGGWVGYRVETWRHEWRSGRRWLVLELTPAPDQVRRCSGCGKAVTAIHDRTVRRIRDLPMFEDPVELEVERLRLACPCCGPRLEQLEWLDAHARVTRRLTEAVGATAPSLTHWSAAPWGCAQDSDHRAVAESRLSCQRLGRSTRFATSLQGHPLGRFSL